MAGRSALTTQSQQPTLSSAHAGRRMDAPVHFLTIRVAGAMPCERLPELRTWRTEQLELAPSDPKLAERFRFRIQQRFFAEYDRLLDENRKVESLLDQKLAAAIRRQLFEQQGCYQLLAYSIMPNHVHVVLSTREPADDESSAARYCQVEPIPDRMDEQPDVRSPLVDYLRQLKLATASAAGSLPDGGVKLDWHGDSFDYWIRSDAELEAIVDYVADNPVSAGLVRSPEQWFFCSVHDRFLHDGEMYGWLPGVAPAPRSE